MTKRKKSVERFIQLRYSLLECPAYLALSSPASRLLNFLLREYNGSENRVAMSRRQAMKLLHTGSTQVAAVFVELVEKGFLRRFRTGAFNRNGRKATTWTLTMVSRNGQPATHDYLKWSPDKPLPGRQDGMLDGDEPGNVTQLRSHRRTRREGADR